jgi:hypothetical protein
MARSGDRPSPLFSFTAYSAFTGIVVGLALLVIWSIWVASPATLALKPPTLNVAALVLLFDIILLSVGSIGLLSGIWAMRFFEDEFTVRSKGVKKAFVYSQVKDVHVYLVFSGFRRRPVLRIDVEGEKQLTITGNPTNRALGTDLYHWLKEKTPGGAAAGEGPDVVPRTG